MNFFLGRRRTSSVAMVVEEGEGFCLHKLKEKDHTSFPPAPKQLSDDREISHMHHLHFGMCTLEYFLLNLVQVRKLHNAYFEYPDAHQMPLSFSK